MCYHRKGLSKLKRELTITEQHGVFFKGHTSWGHVDDSPAGMHVKDKHTTEAEEAILGVISHDGKTIYLVEQDDIGYFRIRLVGPDTMEVLYLESGHAPAVCHKVWRRKK